MANPAGRTTPLREPARSWKTQDSLDLYGVPHWGQGYFRVNGAGHVTVHPQQDPDAPAIDMKELVDQLLARGIQLPILLRFSGVLEHRLGAVAGAFRDAREEAGYKGDYHCVYPIKVNQTRQVVEEVVRFGRPHGFGLEAGSKPELLAVLALVNDSETPIVCNGFKDEEFIEMVTLARKLGRKIIPVVEKASELETIVKASVAAGVRPMIGVRVKLASRGSGRWRSSAGYRSKFGLTLTEVLDAVEFLKEHDMADCLQMVHYHIGSQITNISNIKEALTEAARIYVELKRVGAGLNFIDVGGGLGVDYDGSQTDFESSVNYTLQEYANDVVYRVMGVCDQAGVEHPTIISESGRAMLAYHSVLVFDVRGTHNFDRCEAPDYVPENAPQPIADLYAVHRDLSKKNFIEGYHDAVAAVDQSLNLFNLGYMTVEMRALAERLFWALGRKLRRLVADLDYVPEELENLEELLSDTYFCNFSLFQSMPDSWAIDQLFPIMPIHRLNEEPTRRATLGDITCDSDGKVDRFIDRRDVRKTLELHPFDGEPYYLGAFLLGAYQEILGDMHNLFGDTNAVHIGVGDSGEVHLDELIKGDTVRDVLRYVQFSAGDLAAKMRREVEKAVRSGHFSLDESRQFLNFYESGLEGYTYLE